MMTRCNRRTRAIGGSAGKGRTSVMAATIMGAALSTSALPALATENGVQEFPIGVDTQLPALVPPPGESILLNYTQFYQARQLKDNDGNKAVPDFRLDVIAEAPKFVHTWTRVGGIDISSSIVQPIIHIDNQVIPGVVTGYETNRADTDIIPLMLHTVVGNGLHLELATNIWPKDGFYNVHNPASTGLNRFTWGQQIVTTWLPNPKWNLSTSTMLEFGGTNHTTGYRSGSYVNTDFHIGNRLFNALPKLEVGVQGYFMKQYTSDHLADGSLADGTGNRGRVFGWGPQISYDAWPHGGIVFKYQHEMAVLNRAEGDHVWLQIAIPF